MADDLAPADVERLKSRRSWTSGPGAGGRDAARRAECDAARKGHLDVVLEPDELPRCRHCGEQLGPDALRRAGIKALRP